MENRYKINYDIKQRNINNVKFMQGDTDSSVIEVQLLDNSTNVDITGENIEFRFLKGDNSVVSQNFSNGVRILDAKNGIVECVLKANTLAVAGVVRTEIIRKKDNIILTCPAFEFVVNQSIGNIVLSTNYIVSIENKLIKWQLDEELRQRTFINNEATRQNKFDNNEAIRKSTFEYNETARKNEYSNLKKIIIDENASANLQNQVDDINKELEDVNSQLSDIETGKVTTEDRVFSLKGSTGGYAKIGIEGNTLVNLVPNSHIDMTSSAYGFGNRSVYLEAGKTYTLIVNGNYDQKALDTDKFLRSIIFSSDWKEAKAITIKSLINTTGIVTFVPKFTQEYFIESYLYPDAGDRSGKVTVNWTMLLEGDWTGKPILSHFEGIKSFGEDDSPKLLSCEKNLINLDDLNYLYMTPLPNNSYRTSCWAYPILETQKLNTIFKPNTKYYVKAKYTLNRISELPVYQYHVGFNLYSFSKQETIGFAATNTLKKIGDTYEVNTHFTTPSDLKDRTLLFYTNRYADEGTAEYGEVTVENLMISETPIDNYKPYKPDKIDILTPLGKLPNGVADTRDSDGVVTRKIGKVVLNGADSNWKYFGTNTTHAWMALEPWNGKSYSSLVSDKLPYLTANEWSLKNKAGIYATVSGIGFIYDKGNIATIEQLKQVLATLNPTVCYELAEPIIEQADPLQLQTFQSGTIAINSVIPTKITVEYPCNLASGVQSNSDAIKILDDQLGNLWKDILYIADKELKMSSVKLLETENVTEIKEKINEIIKICKGDVN